MHGHLTIHKISDSHVLPVEINNSWKHDHPKQIFKTKSVTLKFFDNLKTSPEFAQILTHDTSMSPESISIGIFIIESL